LLDSAGEVPMLSDPELKQHSEALETVTRRAVNLLAVFTLAAFTLYALAVFLLWTGYQVAPILMATLTFLGFRRLRPRVLSLALLSIPRGHDRRALEVVLRREFLNHYPDTVLRQLHQHLLNGRPAGSRQRD
jgi:hypothetical protein